MSYLSDIIFVGSTVHTSSIVLHGFEITPAKNNPPSILTAVESPAYVPSIYPLNQYFLGISNASSLLTIFKVKPQPPGVLTYHEGSIKVIVVNVPTHCLSLYGVVAAPT